MVIAAAFLDFWDGFAARMLKVKSEIGAQLDSLADLVSFGVLPAFLIYDLFMFSASDEYWARQYHTGGAYSWGLLIFVYVLAAALRLAKFNVSTDQTTSFKGLPSPAAGLFLSSYALLYSFGTFNNPFANPWLDSYITNCVVLLVAAISLAIFMVLPVRLMALKFKNFSLGDNLFRYLLILGSIVLILFFGFLAIQLIVILYLILSIIQNLIQK